MKDYINKMRQIDAQLSERGSIIDKLRAKLSQDGALIASGMSTTAAVAIGLSAVTPDSQEQTIEQIVNKYERRMDILYDKALPELTAAALQSIADGQSTTSTFKNPLIPNEVVHIYQAREAHPDKNIKSVRLQVQRSTGEQSLQDEFGSLQFTQPSVQGVFNALSSKDFNYAAIRYDGSEAEMIAQQLSKRWPELDLSAFKQFVVAHELAHTHPMMDFQSQSRKERVSDLVALMLINKLNSDRGNLAPVIKDWRHSNIEDSAASPNGSLEALSRMLDNPNHAIHSVSEYALIPFAAKFDAVHDNQQSPTQEQIKEILQEAGATNFNTKHADSEQETVRNQVVSSSLTL